MINKLDIANNCSNYLWITNKKYIFVNILNELRTSKCEYKVHCTKFIAMYQRF